MNNEKTILYNTFYNPMEAHRIKVQLDEAGFACFLADENVANLQYNQAIGGIKLIVFEKDVKEIIIY